MGIDLNITSRDSDGVVTWDFSGRQDATGLEKLMQIVAKSFIQSIGSDPFFPSFGGDVLAYDGKNYSEKLRTVFSVNSMSVESEIKRSQSDELDPEALLADLQLTNIVYKNGHLEITLYVINNNGNSDIVTLPVRGSYEH